MALTNQEKSEQRTETMNQIAREVAKENKDFRFFLIIKGDPENQSRDPTWRRLETFIKQQVEAGQKVRIVLESGVSGD